ncbi:MAG: hypothetical protein ACOYJQ_13345 [Pseudochelatococcus sp.]
MPGDIEGENGSVLRNSALGRLRLAAILAVFLWVVAFWAMDWI